MKVIVGYDRRFFSDRFAQITAEVLAGNNFQVVLTPEPTPTPSVSFAVKTSARRRWRDDYRQPQSADFQRLQTQVVLRRFQQFGRLQGCRGFPRPKPAQNSPLAEAVNGRISVADVRPAHYAALKKLVDFKFIAKSKLRFAHDALVRRWRGLLRAIAGRHNLQSHDAQREARRSFWRHQSRTDCAKLCAPARPFSKNIRTTSAW